MKSMRKIRSETVTIRLDPQLRFLAEMAARAHRRSLSSYIDWLLSKSVHDELGGADIWDVDEAARMRKVAEKMPHLLTYDEQVRLKHG